MRLRIILELAPFLILLLTTSINGLFFHYPKNALTDFFESFHHKKEPKKPPQDIHHYHLHYYPTYAHDLEKPVKAPSKFDLDNVHSNHLESLGWSDHEYKHVPEPAIYVSSPVHDSWPASSQVRSSIWDAEPPNKPQPTLEQLELPKAGLIVQVPIQQKIVVQNPPPDEGSSKNPFLSFLQGIIKIKNSIFKPSQANDKADPWSESHEEKFRGYFIQVPPQFGRQLFH